MIQQPIAGNSLRLFVTPPEGAEYWRVLRCGTDDFVGANDTPNSIIAYQGSDKSFIDDASLLNNVPVFYRPFYWVNGTWVDGGTTASGTPVASFDDGSIDVMSYVRERIESGFKVEVERGNIISELGYVQTYTAPPSLEQNLHFPLITITLESDNPAERAIGEDIVGLEFIADQEDEYFETEGWLTNTRLNITCWSLNSDERVEMRKALRRVIIANLPLLENHGISQVDLSMNDVDAVSGEYDSAIYQVNATLSCMAPALVGRHYSSTDYDIVTDIEVEVIENGEV